jgi:hypothetical protein
MMEFLKREFEFRARLEAILRRGDGLIERRFLSDKVVTDAAVEYVVNSMLDSGTYPVDAFTYHAVGTGTAAEAVTNVALANEVASRVNDASPAAGSSPNIYRTVGSFSFTASFAITEHGVLTAMTGGVLLDRSVFSALNVNSGDSVDFIYQITFTAGG